MRPTSLLALLGLFPLIACASEVAPAAVNEKQAPRVPADVPKWPSAGVVLTPPLLRQVGGAPKKRIYVDAGHGARGNVGTISVTCEEEQDFTLRIAHHLVKHLGETGAFEVMASRESGRAPSYATRLAEAQSWGADALVSLHMDARKGGVLVNRSAGGRECYRSEESTGFAMLWSDEAKGALPARRRALAVALSGRMIATGFEPYDGSDYPGLYENDSEAAGVFLDRHSPGRRIWFLRAPKIPGVIIETHQSWHWDENARWKEEATLDAFSAAVAAGLLDFFGEPVPEEAAAGAQESPASTPGTRGGVRATLSRQ